MSSLFCFNVLTISGPSLAANVEKLLSAASYSIQMSAGVSVAGTVVQFAEVAKVVGRDAGPCVDI